VALSKAELRELAIPGIREKINWHRAEIAKYLEEFHELQSPAPAGVQATASTPSRDPAKPTINDQALEILSTANEPMKAPDVFRAMQTLPRPATKNDTSVYSALAQLAAKSLVKRTDDGYQISAKGRKYLEERQGDNTGGQA
jgi:hypothetical protein